MSGYREITLDEWEQSGEGSTAVTYNSRTDDGIMLKLFNSDRQDAEAEAEFEKTEAVMKSGIDVPKALEIVRCGGKIGIIYERVRNKRSFSKLCHDDPENIPAYAREFARECRKLHETDYSCAGIKSYKESLLEALEKNRNFLDSDKKLLRELIESTPDMNKCVHGDLHSGNILKSGDRNVWIDIGDFSYGNPVFDLGCLYHVCVAGADWIVKHDTLHMDESQLALFWDNFAREYTGSEDDEEKKKFEESIRRYGPVFLVNILKDVKANPIGTFFLRRDMHRRIEKALK